MTTARWTFITNHGLVLSYIFHNPRSTARVIANHIGVTERTTHKIISDLEAAGWLPRTKLSSVVAFERWEGEPGAAWEPLRGALDGAD